TAEPQDSSQICTSPQTAPGPSHGAGQTSTQTDQAARNTSLRSSRPPTPTTTQISYGSRGLSRPPLPPAAPDALQHLATHRFAHRINPPMKPQVKRGVGLTSHHANRPILIEGDPL